MARQVADLGAAYGEELAAVEGALNQVLAEGGGRLLAAEVPRARAPPERKLPCAAPTGKRVPARSATAPSPRTPPQDRSDLLEANQKELAAALAARAQAEQEFTERWGRSEGGEARGRNGLLFRGFERRQPALTGKPFAGNHASQEGVLPKGSAQERHAHAMRTPLPRASYLASMERHQTLLDELRAHDADEHQNLKIKCGGRPPPLPPVAGCVSALQGPALASPGARCLVFRTHPPTRLPTHPPTRPRAHPPAHPAGATQA
jgi:hypothetical protein